MYQITLYISSLLASWLYNIQQPRVVERAVTKTVEIKDPSGLLATDLAWLKRNTKPVTWQKGDTLEAVSYRQGQADLIAVIETKLLGRRIDRL